MCVFLHAHQGALRRHVAEVNEVPTNHAATAWKPLLTARVEAPVFHYTIALTIATLVRVVRSPGRRRRHLEYEVGRSALSVYQLAVAAAHDHQVRYPRVVPHGQAGPHWNIARDRDVRLVREVNRKAGRRILQLGCVVV